MSEAFRLGGWGMYPTTIFGLVLLVAAVRYTVRPEMRQLAVVAALGMITFLSGILGFWTGLIKTFEGAGNHQFAGSSVDIAMIGVSESMHNIALALCLLVLAMIGVAVGLYRRQRAVTSTA